MKQEIRAFFIGFLVFINFGLVRAQSDVYLKIYARTFQRMVVDLYPFVPETPGLEAEKIARLIPEVLSNDLWISGFFIVNKKTSSPPEKGASYAVDDNKASLPLAWIAGDFRLEKNRITLKARVIDRASGRTILSRTYKDFTGKEQYLVHKLADEVVYNLTGERGIASSKIAFVKQKSDGSKEIAIMDYDGFYPKVLTRDGSINLSPEWSPEGDKICYTSYRDGNPNLYLLDVKTGHPELLSDSPGLNSAPAWSPDGRYIALTLTKDGNAEIYLLEVETKKLRRLTYNRAIDSSPSWSPSGREIAFTSDRSGSPQIYIMDSDGANVRRLTFEGSYNASPAWSPRGDKIAFVSRTDTGFDIYSIDVTGENLMRLTENSGSNEDPSWSPNGFALVFSSNRTGTREIYTMFWDGSDQRKLTSGGDNYAPAWSPRLRLP